MILVFENRGLLENKCPKQVKIIDHLNFTSDRNYNEALIILKNGSEIHAENIITLVDTLQFVEVKSEVKRIPLNKIREICFERNPKGILPGFLIGLPAGFAAGYFSFQALKGNPTISGNSDYSDKGVYFLFGGLGLGGIAGALTAWLFGSYIYKF